MDNMMTTWGPLRSVLRQYFTFGSMKEIVGLAGLDVTELADIQRKPDDLGPFPSIVPRLFGPTFERSKELLVAKLDFLLREMTEAERNRFLRITVEEILQRNPNMEEHLGGYLTRLGWTLHEGSLIPIEPLDVSELPELPEEAQSDLVKAATRFRDGDLGGALSAACGAVDTVTTTIYLKKQLGDPGKASFQKKVNKSLKACGILAKLEADLTDLGWQEKDTKVFKNNLTGSLSQAAYIMQTLRSRMGDVHGSKPVLRPLVFDSLKWASLIVRLLKEG